MQIQNGNAINTNLSSIIRITRDNGDIEDINKYDVLRVISLFTLNQPGYRFANKAQVVIRMSDLQDVMFDVQDITNQPTWLATQAGVNQAVSDISEWVTAGNSVTVTPATPVQRIPGLIRTTSSGSIAAGFFNAHISNIGVGVGTVLGTNIDPGVTVGFVADSINSVGAVAYDATGTEFLISEVR